MSDTGNTELLFLTVVVRLKLFHVLTLKWITNLKLGTLKSFIIPLFPLVGLVGLTLVPWVVYIIDQNYTIIKPP